MNRVLLISVKPEFANKIFDGSKRIELRKSRPNIGAGDIVVIYSTVPEKAVIGICAVNEVLEETPDYIWKNHYQVLGIDKKRYFEYYKDSDIAIGIVLTPIQKLPKKIPLDSIRKTFPRFSPPQTFRYFDRLDLVRVYRAALQGV